ncbi:OprO/OprP family phosphate-selective porin [Fulvivirga maritima]|uniref:OprO/OprP family phosphate-selective porin n=1 Tax=Fulvivirga maritima TaxID=2904247 RepID=UPI001F35DE12|nr:porin [Fulvivirga maritima]UII26830.1 OprO/OprP family phosphate-selective porin [Fulvivirga maritima]
MLNNANIYIFADLMVSEDSMRGIIPRIFFYLLFLSSGILKAQNIQNDSTENKQWQINYGSKGVQLRSPDNSYLLQIQGRLQFRFATPSDNDPVTFNDFASNNTSAFKINRARLKVGGHAYKPWLKYYWEYELGRSNLLDFRIMVERWKWFNVKIGQWKVEFNRERRISSGVQQMVDRSILNRAFTVDRQQGVEIYGRLDGPSVADFNYWAGIFTGTGRGTQENDDKNLMYFGRLQWNVTGENLGFKSSDLSIHKTPEAIIALSAVTNRSGYTRFSSSGGGYLQGFENGQAGQYRINQINLETAFVYNGFSWQSELHNKEIIDKINKNTTTLRGFYLQAGYLAHQSIHWWPEPLEIAFRYSNYSPDTDLDNNLEEASVAMNWFFTGHRNKLSMEVSQFDIQTSDYQTADELRFRVQWDFSF